MPRWVVVAAMAALMLGPAASAQEPAEQPAPPLDSEALPTPAESPTRRPRRYTPTPIDTATATPADTFTATAAPSATATRRPQPSATPSFVPATATPTVAGFALGGDFGRALPLIAGGGLALLGIVLGTLIGSSAARLERRRARRTLATAMLLELRRLDALLRRVVELDSSASFPSLEHPIMEAALRDLTLFQTDTAARIAQFHSALRGIQHEIGDYRDNPLRWAGRLGDLQQLIKARAAAACRAVPQLCQALEREGGAPPPQLHDTPAARSAAASPSGLPPPPFGASDGDDWTL